MCRANNIGASDGPNGLWYSADQYHESGFFGAFVAALISIPAAGALQVIAKELWLVTAWQEPPDDAPQPASDP